MSLTTVRPRILDTVKVPLLCLLGDARRGLTTAALETALHQHDIPSATSRIYEALQSLVDVGFVVRAAGEDGDDDIALDHLRSLSATDVSKPLPRAPKLTAATWSLTKRGNTFLRFIQGSFKRRGSQPMIIGSPAYPISSLASDQQQLIKDMYSEVVAH